MAATYADDFTHWLHVIEAEYLEMPGLRLTRPQARRLWNLDERTCDALLDALVAGRFLVKTTLGAYVLGRTTRY